MTAEDAAGGSGVNAAGLKKLRTKGCRDLSDLRDCMCARVVGPRNSNPEIQSSTQIVD